jgi:hypothetical protein
MSKVFNRDVDVMGNLSIGGTITPNPGIMTFGKIFYVDYDNGNDANTGLAPNKAVKTIKRAYDLTTTNKNDVICLSAYSSHVLTEMLTVSKNRVHFVGLGPGYRRYGQRARIYMGITTAATDVFAVKNTGVGNSFTNIKFWSDNTLVTYHIGTVGEGGEYASYNSCEFYSSVKLDSDTHAELVLNGDSAQFYNCTFGSLADSVSGNKVRPAVLLTAATVGAGLVSRDVFFDGCRFWKNAGGTTTAMVKGGATDVERIMEFHNCQFIANVLGAVPAAAIATATLTVGQILLTGDTSCVECTKLATATGIISCLNAKVAATQIGIQING